VTARQLSSRCSAGAVALIAAIASYTHMRGVCLTYGQTPLIATLMPLSVDGLVVVAAIAISDGREHTWSAWMSFWIGIVASVAANVLAAHDDLTARIISAWPAVALLLVVEVISRSAAAPVDQQATAPADPGQPAPETTALDPTNVPSADGESVQVAQDSDPGQQLGQPRSGNVAIVEAAHAANPKASHAELARLTGLSPATIKRYRPEDRPADPGQRIDTPRINGHAIPSMAGDPNTTA
jgi:hypothetical protein